MASPRMRGRAYARRLGACDSRDNGLVVDLEYESKAPYAFTGTVKQVVFDLKPVTSHDEERALHAHASIHAVAQGVGA